MAIETIDNLSNIQSIFKQFKQNPNEFPLDKDLNAPNDQKFSDKIFEEVCCQIDSINSNISELKKFLS